MTSLWSADELNGLAEGLNWASKDTLKPVGNFDADYAALCRVFEVPAHPCLALRLPKNDNINKTNGKDGGSVVAASPKPPSSAVHFRNYTADHTTLRLALEALRRSSDVDTLYFHNAGLTHASVAALVEGLPNTTIRCLGLDYNNDSTVTPSPSLLSVASSGCVRSPSGRLDVEREEGGGVGVVEDTLSTGSCSRIDFADLVREGSKLKALSLRGNGLGDEEAAAVAEAIEENTVLCSLNLFDNAITDVGAGALAKTLRFNTALRGLSLARNRLTSTSAETFGLLLAGGYEVLPEELEKRAAAETKIAAQNKIAQDAMKKKKDAKVETRQPLSAVVLGEDGRSVAGGSRSMAALNLADNPDLGAGGALAGLLIRIVDARKRERDAAIVGGGGGGVVGGGDGGVVLRELHLMRCQGVQSYGGVLEGGGEEEPGRGGEGGGEQAGLIAAASFELRPTRVVV